VKNFRFVDLFCGGGGSVTGAINAMKFAGVNYEGRCFNHWDLAIKTIENNHPEMVPDFERACADIAQISGSPWSCFDNDPERLDILWASPSCTHHSNAAGGKPRSNQLRSQPEHLLPFLRLTKCRRMFVENVVELKNWGPILEKDTVYKGKLYKAGQADPRKAGLFFNDWIRDVKHSGFHVDMAVMNAADYGAATSRERLIIQAVRKSSGEKIVWPEQTHAKDPELFGYKPWRSAAEIIDWSIPGESIFDRKKPLCPNTLRRIEAGIKKYWGAWAEPFLIVLRGTSNSAINSTAPLPTITAEGGHIALIRPFLSRYNGGDNRNHSASDPIPVIDCSNRYGVVTPVIMDMSHPGDMADAARCKGGSDPMGTITCRNNWGVAMPFVSSYYSPGTNTPGNDPVPTITTKDRFGIVEPFLTAYYGNGFVSSVRDAVPTITTKDRFGVVQGRILILPDGRRYKLDITHRMLTSRELAAATGFPAGYKFAGSDTDAKKMIGNAVCPDLAEALYRAVLSA
jgi:DNA (cytosine-5)-methyltransferase 1